MTVRELVEKLKCCDPNLDVMVLDGENGQGVMRELNLGPTYRLITQTDEDITADCEGRVGRHAYVVGYGNY